MCSTNRVVIRGNTHLVEFVDGRPVGIARSMADPGAPGGAHERVEGRAHAAGGLDELDRLAAAREPVRVGFPVGDDDELVIGHLVPDQFEQGVFVPHGKFLI
jgi:hypothetical protein